jgi:hypothetical protein
MLVYLTISVLVTQLSLHMPSTCSSETPDQQLLVVANYLPGSAWLLVQWLGSSSVPVSVSLPCDLLKS